MISPASVLLPRLSAKQTAHCRGTERGEGTDDSGSRGKVEPS